MIYQILLCIQLIQFNKELFGNRNYLHRCAKYAGSPMFSCLIFIWRFWWKWKRYDLLDFLYTKKPLLRCLWNWLLLFFWIEERRLQLTQVKLFIINCVMFCVKLFLLTSPLIPYFELKSSPLSLNWWAVNWNSMTCPQIPFFTWKC